MIICELDKHLDEIDYDIFLLFMENEKRSGGGDILQITKSTKDNSIKLVFQNEAEVEPRLLQKKFILFKDYVIRISRTGFQTDLYKIDLKQVILANIDESIDQLSIDLFSENLSPNNPIIKQKKSNVFENSLFIEYQNEFDIERVKQRYSNRNSISKKKILLFTCYYTSALILRHSCSEKMSIAKLEINALLRTAKIIHYMHQVNSTCFLIQFSDENDYNTAFDVIKQTIETYSLLHEYCFSFELAKSLSNESSKSAKNNLSKKLKKKKNIEKNKAKLIQNQKKKIDFLIQSDTKLSKFKTVVLLKRLDNDEFSYKKNSKKSSIVIKKKSFIETHQSESKSEKKSVNKKHSELKKLISESFSNDLINEKCKMLNKLSKETFRRKSLLPENLNIYLPEAKPLKVISKKKRYSIAAVRHSNFDSEQSSNGSFVSSCGSDMFNMDVKCFSCNKSFKTERSLNHHALRFCRFRLPKFVTNPLNLKNLSEKVEEPKQMLVSGIELESRISPNPYLLDETINNTIETTEEMQTIQNEKSLLSENSACEFDILNEPNQTTMTINENIQEKIILRFRINESQYIGNDNYSYNSTYDSEEAPKDYQLLQTVNEISFQENL